MFKFKMKSSKGATLVEYGVMVAMMSVVAIVSLAAMGNRVGASMEDSGENLSEVSASASGSASTAPSLTALTASQISELDANGSIVFPDGTFIFVGSTQKQDNQSLELVDPEGVTLRWNGASDCPTGPITASGSTVMNCNYTDPALDTVPLYVRVPGDGYLTSSTKSDPSMITTCTRATTVREDTHEYFCAN